MEKQKYEELVARLGELARKDPARYKLRVLFFALFGYGYIFFFLGALLACLLVIYFWGFAVPLLILILWALWVRLDAPTGLPLESEQAPRLFQLLRKTSAAFHRPNFHRVLITQEMNAGVVQTPRLGVFGWHKNYLCLGMPVLLALSPQQFEALLGHEFAHLFGAHSRFMGWIVRVRQTWQRLVFSLETRRQRGAFVFLRFFQWYAPLFSAYAFALERTNEVEADRFSADWVGAEHAAACLVNLRIFSAYWNNFLWPRIRKNADAMPEPNLSLYGTMRDYFQKGVPHEAAQEALRRSLLEPTSVEDPHPALRERLEMLGQPATIPASSGTSAAEHFLGPTLPQILEKLDVDWRQHAEAPWRRRFEACEGHRARLRELTDKSQNSGLSQDESLEFAQRTEDLQGSDAAYPLYRAILEHHPESAAAQFGVGNILLGNGEEAGIAHLENAMARDADYGIEATQRIREFLLKAGREKEAEAYSRQFANHVRRRDAIRRARSIANARDRYVSHDLTEVEVRALTRQFPPHPQIGRVYLVRKLMPEDNAKPILFVGILWRRWWPVGRENTLVQRLAHEWKVPRQDWAVVPLYNRRELLRAFRRVPNSLVYRRPIWHGLRKLVWPRTSPEKTN